MTRRKGVPEAHMIRRAVLLLAFACASTPVARADDLQAWQWLTAEVFSDEDWRFYLYVDNRIGDDLSRSYLRIVSPRLKYHLDENVDLGLGYAFLDIDPLSAAAGDFWQHRAEFEFNPHFSSGPWSFHNRNRMELRWNDGQGRRLPRLRNRIEARYQLEDGFFAHLYANNEFFFDLTRGDYTENRFVPAGLGMKLSDRAILNLFYMIQSRERADGWEHAHVIGAFLQIK